MRTAAAVSVIALIMGACSNEGMMSADESFLAAVSPAGGAIGVSVNSGVTLQFTHKMAGGMEQYVALHEGGANGPAVNGVWTWSSDRKTLSFAPASPLKPKTLYTIHVGGGMRDDQNHMVGLERNGMMMGGQWTAGSMMGGNTGMMGTGWQHANGSYGMIFTFTTS